MNTLKNIFAFIRKNKGISLLIFLIVFLFGGYGTTKFMETPTFCSICHSMRPYVQSFLQSGHGTANLTYKCMECHGEARLGTIRNKYLGTVYSHATDGLLGLIAHFQGRKVEVEFDPDYPRIPSERCFRCHASDSKVKNAFPVTAEMHSKPIDVSSEFNWVLNNPRGKKYQCKVCHNAITHPRGGNLLPFGKRGKKGLIHRYTRLPRDTWTQIHLRAMDQGILKIDGRILEFDRETCRREGEGGCHFGKLEPQKIRSECQGCHSKNHKVAPPKKRVKPLSTSIPNINDSMGAKGEVK